MPVAAFASRREVVTSRVEFAPVGKFRSRRSASRETIVSSTETLQNYLCCGLIHAALPAARIILVQRHPMDACWAIYKAHFQGKFGFSYHKIELAEYYLAYRRLSRHWRATLPPNALLEIRYEEIIADQSATSRRLIDFIGLPWDDEVLRFYEKSGALSGQPVRSRCDARSIRLRWANGTITRNGWRRYAPGWHVKFLKRSWREALPAGPQQSRIDPE